MNRAQPAEDQAHNERAATGREGKGQAEPRTIVINPTNPPRKMPRPTKIMSVITLGRSG